MTPADLPAVPTVDPGAWLPVYWSGIPRELHDLPRWALWRAIPQDSGKPKKLPIQVGADRPASSTDPATWASFGDCWRAYRSGSFTGIVFALGEGYAAIDLDDSRDPLTGAIDPWAAALAGRLASYTEVSPSGAGLHVLIRGRVPKGINTAIDGHRIEAYSSKRFLCMTGWAVAP